MKVDLGALANRKWGWGNDARIIREVGIEAVRTHPARTRGGSRRRSGIFSTAGVSALQPGGDAPQPSGPPAPSGTPDTIVIGGRTLPRPTEGERIPGSHYAGPTSPDGSIYAVWTSPTSTTSSSCTRATRSATSHSISVSTSWERTCPSGQGTTPCATLNLAARGFPPPFLWLVLGMVGLAVRRPAGVLALVTPAVAALPVIVLDALAIPSVPHYAVPAAPAFILLAAGALAAQARVTVSLAL